MYAIGVLGTSVTLGELDVRYNDPETCERIKQNASEELYQFARQVQRTLCGAALRSWLWGLPVSDPGERSQGIVYRACIRKCASHVRIKGYDDRPAGQSRRIGIRPSTAEIVLGKNVVFANRLRVHPCGFRAALLRSHGVRDGLPVGR